MTSVLETLSNRVSQAIRRTGVEGDPMVRVAQDEQFGDYQSNCAMGLAQKLKKNPREVAEEIRRNLEVDELCEPVEVAGPGFLNFRLKPAFLARSLAAIPKCVDSEEDRLGITPVDQPETVVIDFSSPNLAKEMHVGHLRSTVIGECIARLLEFEGHRVIRENHIGDWGTQFGMLLAHLKRIQPEVLEQPDRLSISDLEAFYIEAKKQFDSDEEFKAVSRDTVVALQSGDPIVRRLWKAFCDESLRHCHAIYERLGVKLIDRGESFYADLMGDVIKRLEAIPSETKNRFVEESQGALCLFMEGFQTREGEPLPLIIRKSDGGFNYATSDLATILHRVEHLKADRIIYVVGLPQKQHFEMVFSAVRKAGWVTDRVSLIHLGFGSMLNAQGKPFRTREGGTVKLKDLLDEAVIRARKIVADQPEDDFRPHRSMRPQETDQVAEIVGMAAVKYFDLSHSLSSDYRFDFETMLNLEGNTAPYMLYAYARIQSIGRKAGVHFASLPQDQPIVLAHPSEIALATKLLQFSDVVGPAARELRPNALTEYLYELAKRFSRFYDKKLGVRVIDASPEQVRTSRLRLCDLTARTLRLGLRLLGIGTLEQM